MTEDENKQNPLELLKGLQFNQIFNSFQHQADQGGLPDEEAVRSISFENGGLGSTKNGGFWSTESWTPFVIKSIELAKNGELKLTPEQINRIVKEADRVTKMLLDSGRLIEV